MPIDLVYNLGVRHLTCSAVTAYAKTPTVFLCTLRHPIGWFGRFHVLRTVRIRVYFGRNGCRRGAILTTSLWCLGSWYYRLIFGKKR